MREFYDINKRLYDILNTNPLINSITEGDIDEVDLNKRTIFPLAHINCRGAELGSNYMTFEIAILLGDVVDEPNEVKEGSYSPFFGLTNRQDVLNSMLSVANEINQAARKGQLADFHYRLNTDPSVERFEDRFENKLTGWTMLLSITVPNVDICVPT